VENPAREYVMSSEHVPTLDLRRLEYFLAVVDTGTITSAAEMVSMTQPALGRQIRALERDLALTLFTRQGRRLQLTYSGRRFVPIARDLVQRARLAGATARKLAERDVSELRIFAHPATIEGLVAPFVATLSAQEPLLLVQELRPPFEYDVLQREADLVLSPQPVSDGFASRSLGEVHIRAHAASSHLWAMGGRTRVALSEVVTERLILMSTDHRSRVLLDNAVARSGLRYPDIVEASSGAHLHALTAAGHGIGVATDLPRYGTHSMLIDQPDLEATLSGPLYAAWLPDHRAAPMIEGLAIRMASFLSEVIQGLTLGYRGPI
jgi:DNA-binding transcriptional LysR family regulator